MLFSEQALGGMNKSAEDNKVESSVDRYLTETFNTFGVKQI